MHAQHGEMAALHALAFQLWLIPDDPSSFKWHSTFSEVFVLITISLARLLQLS